MQHPIKITVLVLSITGLLAANPVLAETAVSATTDKLDNIHSAPEKCDHEDKKQKHFDALKTALKLSTDQESGWSVWRAKMTEGRKTLFQNFRHEDLASLPAPERLEKMLTFSKEHVALQEARLIATKTFYATLTPEQRLVFDKESRFEHRSHFGKH